MDRRNSIKFKSDLPGVGTILEMAKVLWEITNLVPHLPPPQFLCSQVALVSDCGDTGEAGGENDGWRAGLPACW